MTLAICTKHRKQQKIKNRFLIDFSMSNQNINPFIKWLKCLYERKPKDST